MSSMITAVSQLLDALGRVPFIVQVLTKGSLLILMAIVLTRLLARAPAAARHLVWSLSVAGLLLLPAAAWIPWRLELTMLASARDVMAGAPPVAPVADAPQRSALVRPASSVTSIGSPSTVTPVDGSMRDLTIGTLQAPSVAPSDVRWLRDPAAILVLTWLGGILWMVGRLVLGMASVRRMVRHSTPVDGGEWRAAVDNARRSLGARRVAGIVISDVAAMPFTYGLLHPIIVLPASAEDWTAERRRSVLLHELAHVRRRDLLTNALVQVACAVYWFHPLVRLAARRVRIEAERACDALVVAAGTRPSDYAGDLLEIARTMRSSATAAVALAMARRSDFEGRLLAILAPDSGRNVLTAARAALVALAFAAPAAAVAAAVPARSAAPNAAVVTNDGRSVPDESDNAVAPVGGSALASTSFASRAAQSGAADSQAPARTQGRDAVVPGLLSVLADDNADVRLAAVEALGQLADPRAIDALAQALRTDTDARVREAAAQALGDIDSPRPVPALVAALGSERVTAVRAKIAWALGEIEDARAVDALGTALRDSSVEVRRQAVWALGEIESVNAVPMLIPLLRDSDAETRKQAAWALGQIESPDAITALSAAVKDSDANVRQEAVGALGEIEDQRALPALTAALGDADVEVRRKAVWAIGELDELRSAPPGLIAALRDEDREVKKAAAEAVGHLEDEAAVPALIPLTRDTDPELKRAAVEALAEIGGARAIEAIVVLLKDDDPEIRKLAAQALGKNR